MPGIIFLPSVYAVYDFEITEGEASVYINLNFEWSMVEVDITSVQLWLYLFTYLSRIIPRRQDCVCACVQKECIIKL